MHGLLTLASVPLAPPALRLPMAPSTLRVPAPAMRLGYRNEQWQWGRGGGNVVQGGALRTFQSGSPFVQQGDIALGTEGRPLDAEIELWDGPGNTPSKMRVWSEDGFQRPLNARVGTPQGRPHTFAVRNRGPIEFPMGANVGAVEYPGRPGGVTRMGPGYLPTTGYPGAHYPDAGYYAGPAGYAGPGRQSARYAGSMAPATPTAHSSRVQGGSLQTFQIEPNVETVEVILSSEGMPISGTIELLQGPNTNKQVIELYTDDGRNKPISYLLQTPGYGSVVSITNTGPMEYPMNAAVVPHTMSHYGMRPRSGGYGRRQGRYDEQFYEDGHDRHYDRYDGYYDQPRYDERPPLYNHRRELAAPYR